MARKRQLQCSKDILKYINRFPGLIYTGSCVKCTFCNVNLLVYTAHDCKVHIGSKRHTDNIKNRIPYWTFLNEFIVLLSVCNIPQRIVENDTFRQFWETYIPAWKLPSRKQLRTHLPRVNNLVKNTVQSEVKNNKIWITVNEVTDAKKNSVVNVLVRTLKPNEPSFPFLLCSKRLTETNAEAIIEVVKDAVRDFGIHETQIGMLVTDGAANMLKTGIILKTYFPNLLHITCLLDACYFIADIVRKSYSTVDRLIANTNTVFVKSKWIRELKTFCPGIPIPPESILTRKEAWFEAVLYYSKYFQNLKSFILKLNLQDCKAIQISQQLFSDHQVEMDIAEICEKYSLVGKSIEQLQNSQLSLAESLNIVDNLKNSMETLKDNIGLYVAQEFNTVLDKNPDLNEIQFINQCINNNQACENEMFEYFKFANITLLDAQRSFSKYEHAFSSFRRSLNESTLETILMLQVSASSLQCGLPLLVNTFL